MAGGAWLGTETADEGASGPAGGADPAQTEGSVPEKPLWVPSRELGADSAWHRGRATRWRAAWLSPWRQGRLGRAPAGGSVSAGS